jgi:hypothetical protein
MEAILSLQKMIEDLRAQRDALDEALQALEAPTTVLGVSVGRRSGASPGRAHWSQTPQGKKRLAEIVAARRKQKAKGAK